MTMFGVFAILTLFLFTNGCNNIQSIDKRQKNVETIASQADLKLERIEAGSFLLTTYHKGLEGSDKNLVIYIEGDGNAWDSRYQLSENPTPKNPLALKLAAKDTLSKLIFLNKFFKSVDYVYTFFVEFSFFYRILFEMYFCQDSHLQGFNGFD